MKKVLVINASARNTDSRTRKLTEIFVGQWKRAQENAMITYRDLGNAGVPHIDENWIAASFKPAAARSREENSTLAASDIYISELREADVIVLGTPMYNWSIPSTLKAYIDHVLRVNETFTVNPADPKHPYIGLLQNKTMFLLLSRGLQGYEKGEENEHMNFQSTYLKTVFNIMGITNIQVVAIDGASLGAAHLQTSTAKAHQAINDLVTREFDPR